MNKGVDEGVPVRSQYFIRQHVIFGFCVLIALISFKPSEPYLSEYLTCNLTDQKALCSKAARDAESCNSVISGTCKWNVTPMVGGETQTTCEVASCSNLVEGCGTIDNTFRYCKVDKSTGLCTDMTCYKLFTESQVNNEIYPWSGYGYLPLLLILGSAAEVFSYRYTIILGIMGRLVTRFLLLFGHSLCEMQIMQLTYAMGSAAEDVFKAYVYYVVPEQKYQEATSYIAASALLSSVFAGLVGDFLVLSGGVSLEVLMIISACFVSAGTVVSFIVIQPPRHGTSVVRRRLFSSCPSALQICGEDSKASIAYHKLRAQFQQLRSTLRNSSMRGLLLWWVCGNAIYLVVYNYEVSIYNELHGSNEWNGTAIACMLLMGAGGAMAPVWMGVDKWDTQSAAFQRGEANSQQSLGESEQEEEREQGQEQGQGPIWDGDETLCQGGLGRAAAVSTHQSPLETEAEARSEFSSSPSLHPAPRGRRASYYLSINITLLLLMLGALSVLSLLFFLLSWSVVPSISMLALFFAAWQCISAVFFVQLALFLRSLVEEGESGTVTTRREGSKFVIEGEEEEGEEDAIAGADEGVEMTYSVENPLAYTHRASRTSRYVKLSTDRSTEPGAAAPGRSASCGINVDCPAMCALGERGDRAPSSVPPPLFDTFGRAVEQNAEKEEKKEREFSDTTVSSPANSLVIVSVVGASALIQCVIQAVLLTWLNSPLRVACTRLVLLFLLSTSLFAVQSVLRVGMRALLHSLTDLPLFSVTRHSQQLTGQHTDTAPAGIEVSSSSWRPLHSNVSTVSNECVVSA